MQNGNLDETQPRSIADNVTPQKSKRLTWIRPLILGGVLILATAFLGAFGGYRQGIDDRLALEFTQAAEDIEGQYQLGLQDFQAGELERARQRFEYIIEQDPNHSRAIEMLARTLSILQATSTPTPIVPTATPTVTPTPDLRSMEEKLSNAQANMAAGEWDLAIATLLNLRKEDPSYEAIRVDSMLYVALRNRGVEKILNRGELEGGLYDLAQAELFGPLDADAQGYANWARLYTIGASFWQVDWGQAAFFFGQVAPFTPNLHDGTNWTAYQRYVEALENYINALAELEEWCKAQEQSQVLLDFVGDPGIEPTATWLDNKCNPPRPTRTPGPIEETPTLSDLPTETPGTPLPTTETATEPAPPTETPAPSPTPAP